MVKVEGLRKNCGRYKNSQTKYTPLITSSYYKHSEAAILVFALDNPDTFHILSQHLLDIVTYAENAKIFLSVPLFSSHRVP